jgi:hypothetical protein
MSRSLPGTAASPFAVTRTMRLCTGTDDVAFRV